MSIVVVDTDVLRTHEDTKWKLKINTISPVNLLFMERPSVYMGVGSLAAIQESKYYWGSGKDLFCVHCSPTSGYTYHDGPRINNAMRLSTGSVITLLFQPASRTLTVESAGVSMVIEDVRKKDSKDKMVPFLHFANANISLIE